MSLLFEFLSLFLPDRVRTRRDYLVHGITVAAMTFPAVLGLGSVLGHSLGSIAPWALQFSACVGAGYLIVYPFVRRRLNTGGAE
ncbi:hypothetical protein D7318_16545 [Streptomyces radicis]|uniref:Uncharacterized protein n=1 Tax=Streptomyces radicis TaxID=1750517 RepID=A0ABX9RD76_9ACTN|nr:hypothetical protein D7318_16545 [Streptomyces radicis]